MSTRASAIALLFIAAAGLLFSGVSTFDFVQHLDRQVHDLHCSFVPGLVEADEHATGCQVTLLSPYSSVLRTALWGGIPISLASMSIFALLGYRAAELLGRPPAQQRTATAVLLALVLIPVGASLVMGTIAVRELDAACKLCIGIYISSGLSLLVALAAWRHARQAALTASDPSPGTPIPSAGAMWLAAAGQLFVFTATPIVAYASVAPDYSGFIGACGGLSQPDDPYGVMIELGGTGDTPVIEVFDPLCPACKGLEERMAASDVVLRLSRRAVLFPLDSECNWMVQRSLHPGACRVSEAVLCAVEDASVPVQAVIDWAFAEQAALTEAGARDPDEVTRRIAARFTTLAPCLRSASVQSQLNKSLRWIVANQLTVLTPQIFIDGVKLCDEDTDLGLEFSLTRMLERHDAGTLAGLAPKPTGQVGALVPGSEAPPAPTPRAKSAKRPRPVAAPTKATTTTTTPTKTTTTTPPPADAGALPDVDALPPAEPEPESQETP